MTYGCCHLPIFLVDTLYASLIIEVNIKYNTLFFLMKKYNIIHSAVFCAHHFAFFMSEEGSIVFIYWLVYFGCIVLCNARVCL